MRWESGSASVHARKSPGCPASLSCDLLMRWCASCSAGLPLSKTLMPCRFPGPRYLQAKNRLRKGLACPVLMIYSGQDKALGPELVKARPQP